MPILAPPPTVHRILLLACIVLVSEYTTGVLLSAPRAAIEFAGLPGGRDAFLAYCNRQSGLGEHYAEAAPGGGCLDAYLIRRGLPVTDESLELSIRAENESVRRQFASSLSLSWGDARVALFAATLMVATLVAYDFGILATRPGRWKLSAAYCVLGLAWALLATVAAGAPWAQLATRLPFYGLSSLIFCYLLLSRTASIRAATLISGIGLAGSSLLSRGPAADTVAYWGNLIWVWEAIVRSASCAMVVGPVLCFVVPLWREGEAARGSADGTAT